MEPRKSFPASRWPAGTPFPLYRPFSVVFDTPADKGTAPVEGEPEATPEPLLPDDLTALDPKALSDLRKSLLKQHEAIQKSKQITPEIAAQANAIADAIEAVVTESQNRAAAEAAQKEEMTKAAERVASLTAEPEAEADETPEEPEGTPEPEKAKTTPAKTAPKAPPVAEPIAASAADHQPTRTRPRAPSVADAARLPQRAEDRPLPAPQSRGVILAAGNIGPYQSGQQFETAEDIGEAFAQKAEMLVGTSGGKYSVARWKRDYTPEQTLTASAHDSDAKLDAFQERQVETIVAAGGICAPAAPDWSINVPYGLDRPVRDSAGNFTGPNQARGGVIYTQPPRLTDLAGASVVWTNANDAVPGAANQGTGGVGNGPLTKPIVTVSCGSPITVYADAIPVRLRVGNFDRRTWPEHFEAWWRAAQSVQARVAENHLLDAMETFSASSYGAAVTTGPDLGASRDILDTYIRLSSNLRNANRIPRDFPLQVWLPEWVPDMMLADLIREQPGASVDRLAMQVSDILSYFTGKGLSITWYKDSATAVSMIIADQSSGTINRWKSTVVGYMAPAGSVFHLDEGTLDLGIDIRDSTLNALNNVEAFMETFEALYFKGIKFLKITNTVNVDGSSSAAKSFTDTQGS